MTSAPAKKAPAAKPAAKPAKAGLKPAVKSAVKSGVKAAAKAAKPAAKPVVVVETPAPSTPTAGGTLRAKDLIARVAGATGAKVKDIKATVEATLAELGRALDAGEALNLPPLGRVKITPAKTAGSTQPMKLKLRRGAGGAQRNKQDKEALAEVGEDS